MTHWLDDAIDLFAGPGGWDWACKALGFHPLGIELDSAACETRDAVGLRTLRADVSALEPLDFGPVRLVIASAPCPTFSAAGKGGGRHLTEIIVRCLHEIAAGNDTRAECRQEAYEVLRPIYREAERVRAAKKKREPDFEAADHRSRRDAEMSLLVVESLRWIVALQPRWVALEQVPEVLPLWSQMAQILATFGYSSWTGVMEAERYGVAQTRERAILIADREEPVDPPRPTHQRYVKGEPQRHEVTLEGEVMPWVSMAEALPRFREGAAPAPAPTVSGGGTGSGGGVEVFAGADDRRRAAAAVALRNGNQENSTVRRADEPASTVLFGHRANDVRWVMEKSEDRPERKADGAGNQPRSSDEPSATIDTRSDLSRWVYDRRQQKDGVPAPTRSVSEPAPTLSANGLAKSTHLWVAERPATTVAGDDRIFPPGGHLANDGRDNSKMVGRSEDAVRVSLEEAAILQSFPPDYPFQGTKSKRFEQVGNAVPPLLAYAILSSLLAPMLGTPRSAGGAA